MFDREARKAVAEILRGLGFDGVGHVDCICDIPGSPANRIAPDGSGRILDAHRSDGCFRFKTAAGHVTAFASLPTDGGIVVGGDGFEQGQGSISPIVTFHRSIMTPLSEFVKPGKAQEVCDALESQGAKLPKPRVPAAHTIAACD